MTITTVILVVGSSILAVVTLVVMYLVAGRHRWGWMAYILLQVLWAPYDVLTQQYGLIGLSILLVGIAIRGWRRDRQDRSTKHIGGW